MFEQHDNEALILQLLVAVVASYKDTTVWLQMPGWLLKSSLECYCVTREGLLKVHYTEHTLTYPCLLKDMLLWTGRTPNYGTRTDNHTRAMLT